MGTLPTEPKSFAGVSRAEILGRARELVPKLKERAAETEALRRLPDATERELHDAGLFRIVQPSRVGGLELDYGIMLDVCAELGRGCASAAWNVGNLASHHWMLGMFEPKAQDEVWHRSSDSLIATSLAFPAGRGQPVEGGYRVTGRWPFSSGVDNSDWDLLAATIRAEEKGPPTDFRFCLVHRSEFQVIDNWHALGLRGTGSKDVAVKDLFVPAHRTLSLRQMTGGPTPGSKVNPGPLYRMPMIALGSFVLAGSAVGNAQGALDDYVGAARKRATTYTGAQLGGFQAVQIKVAEAAASIDTALTLMRAHCAQGQAEAEAGRVPDLDTKLRWRRDAAFGVNLCTRAVDLLMGVSGAGGLYDTGVMQRQFRDAHAINAHIVYSFDVVGSVWGQHALGQLPEPPLL